MVPFPFPRSFGNTRKNSFASFSSNTGSGRGIEAKGNRCAPSPGTAADFRALDLGLDAPLLVPLFVFVVFVDMDVLQNAEGVIGQNHNRTVKRDQVGSDGLVVDAHEANREARRYFPWNSGLE
jgi:hypothetical protein